MLLFLYYYNTKDVIENPNIQFFLLTNEEKHPEIKKELPFSLISKKKLFLLQE